MEKKLRSKTMIDLKKLKEPFPESDLEWRISRAGEKNGKVWAQCVVYIDARAVRDRLNEVCGAENWKNDYKEWHRDSQLCGISIYLEERKEWITKWDGADNTEFEGTKGGLSDAEKRACSQWGIGDYLYKLSEMFANVCDNGIKYQPASKNPKKPCSAFKWNPPQMPLEFLPKGSKMKPPIPLPEFKPKHDPVKPGEPEENQMSIDIIKYNETKKISLDQIKEIIRKRTGAFVSLKSFGDMRKYFAEIDVSVLLKIYNDVLDTVNAEEK